MPFQGVYNKLVLGGVMLSILIFLFPPLYGEGYDTIELLLNGISNMEWDTVMNNSLFYGYGNLLLVYLLLIVLFGYSHRRLQMEAGDAEVFCPFTFFWAVLLALYFLTSVTDRHFPGCQRKTLLLWEWQA